MTKKDRILLWIMGIDVASFLLIQNWMNYKNVSFRGVYHNYFVIVFIGPLLFLSIWASGKIIKKFTQSKALCITVRSIFFL